MFKNEKTGKYETDFSRPEYLQIKAANEVADYVKQLGSPIDAKAAKDVAKATSDWFTSDAKIAENALALDKRVSSFANADNVRKLLALPNGKEVIQNLASIKGTANVKDGMTYLDKLDELIGTRTK